jgi:aconitate hydratase 2/2-methylisocitrate dehydratase
LVLNQARVKDNATVVSTSTRNFPNRLGDNADVYLSSAEVAAIAAKLGHIVWAAQPKVQLVALIGLLIIAQRL